MSQYLNRDQILEAQDLVTEEVNVPEWGGVVLVRSLTGAERDLFEESVNEIRGRDRRFIWKNARAKLCALSIVDGDGKRIFSDKDIVELGNKNASALDRVYTAATRLSGIGEDRIDEIVKNSLEGPSEDSGID